MNPLPLLESSDTHLVCCSADIALCGEFVGGTDWADDGTDCPMCGYMDDHNLPCSVLGCGESDG